MNRIPEADWVAEGSASAISSIDPLEAPAARPFDYDEAFSRNIGWLTSDEQIALAGKRVAIAGLGGVGGSHLLTLARLGIGRFHIADFDTFDLVNFNRQAGAFVSTLGEPKTEVLARMARDVNPHLELGIFRQAVDRETIDAFLEGVDIYVDGLDYFAFDARDVMFAACARKRIPATIAAPLGMGASLLNFLPGGMTFDDFFRWGGCSDEEKALRFLVGLAPAMLHRHYLAHPAAVNLAERRGPSTAMACELCAGVAATEVLKILLRRGPVVAAPRGVHFDAFLNKLRHTWRPGGNANPVQRLAIAIAKRQLGIR
jgi:molybdopterin/thiamine biosynthesis adenylyltransferase